MARKTRRRNAAPPPTDPVALLNVVARNLWWSWNPQARELFEYANAPAFKAADQNPIVALRKLSAARKGALAADADFLRRVKQVHADLRRYLRAKAWYAARYGRKVKGVTAYFCMEYAVHESLPLYAGGLGVLAGDHLKSASDMDIPLVAMGLLYQQGYFRQRLNADGWQLELYPRNDFHNMPVELMRGDDGQPLTVSVEMMGRATKAQIWRLQVGKTALYLLDTNVPGNTPEDRHITSQLYGGDQ